GFVLGISLNLANSLPDLEQDAAHGTRTLAVFLGLRGAFALCQALIVLCAALIGALMITGIVPANPWIVVPVLMITCLLVIVLLLFFGPDRPLKTRKIYFYLVTLICILLAGGWLVGVLI